MKRLLCLVVLLMPLAAGAPEQIEADLVITQILDLPAFAEVGAPPAAGTTLGPIPPGLSAADAPPHTCGDATPTRRADGENVSFLNYYAPGGRGLLRFYEGPDQSGCAEARYEIQLPALEGALGKRGEFDLRFQADRRVSTNGLNAETYVEQGVAFYRLDQDQHKDDPYLEPLGCFDNQEIFSPGDAVVGQRWVNLTFDWGRCGEDLRGKKLVMAFYFRDASPQHQAGDVPPSTAQSFTASVAQVSIRYEGARVPVALAYRSGSDPQQKVVGYLEAKLTAPPATPGQQQEITFALSNKWGIHALYEENDDVLFEVDASAIKSRESKGTLHFTLSKDLLDNSNSGVYVVVFVNPGTGQVEAYRVPLVAMALLGPLVAGLLAQRNLNHLYRASRGRLARLRWTLQATLVAAWSLYVGVAVTLVVASTGLGMAAWPLPLANLVAYILLFVTVIIMVVVGFMARRRDMALVLEDLSELEKIQAELERSNRELEQFAYVASHDLKEPLRMVAGYTQLLEMRYGKKLDAQGKEFLLFAAEGSRRLQHMVDDLLAYSRVRSDESAFKEVKLATVMSIVEGHLKGLINERGVRLVYGELPVVHGDQGQLVQLLLNLVQNAIKFSPQDKPLVEVTAVLEGDRYRLSVRDEGIGIEPAQQERIFQIFQRLHLREEYEGNGIGLAMCKKIAEQLGGRISVASEPGKGATFTVLLPDLRRAPRAVRAAAPVARPRADSPA